MIVLHLTWLLNSLHLAASYRYLPKNELPTYSNGAKTAYHKYRAAVSDVPFHVLIVYNSLYCSGALVRSKIVITAASCLITDKVKRPVVKVGCDTITGMGQIIPVVDIKIHEYYRYMSRIDNDIAMLVLKEHVTFSKYVKKAILVEPEVALRTGVSIEVSGYGSTNLAQAYVNQLIWTEMLIIDKEECDEHRPHLRTPSNFCAKYIPNLAQAYVNQLIWTEMLIIDKEECDEHRPHLRTPSNFCAKYIPERRLSDSGGPAIYNRELLVGILSHGGTSNDEPHIAIFTNISYFHRWILLNTKRFLEKYCTPKSDSSRDSGTSSEESDSSQ